MRSHARSWIIALPIALLASILVPFPPGVGRGAQPPALVIVSPPAGLGVPVGQHIGLRYRFVGEAPAMLEITVDGAPLRTDWVQPGQEVLHAWAPRSPRRHQLRVRAVAPDGTVLGTASLSVIGLPGGARVRVP